MFQQSKLNTSCCHKTENINMQLEDEDTEKVICIKLYYKKLAQWH